MSELRCYGCGAKIQSEDPKRPGYLPAKAKQGKEQVLCQRCFKLLHYHTKIASPLTQDDFLKVISKIGDEDALVVYILDLFDFNASQIPGLMRHIGYNDVLVLANKRDLLPASLKEHRLMMWVRRQLKAEGLKPVDVIITSGKKNLNFDEIYEKIDAYRHGRDVYVVGTTNVGKSTFINGLLKHYAQVTTQITTSEFPGTTLDLIKIPFDETSSLYDTPGIMNTRQMTSRVDDKVLKLIMPQSEVKAMTYQLSDKQSLYIEGLARMDYIEGEKGSFTCFFSKRLKIHRTKLENADGLYNRHKTLAITLPEIQTIDQMKAYEFTFDGTKQDIVIAGLGFISIKTKGKVVIRVPEGIDVIVREPLV